jgi:hypothetical protein
MVVVIGWLTCDGDYYRTLASMQLRNSNSYVYFAFGIAAAIITIDLSMRLTTWVGGDRIKPYLFLGETSLFIFCFGNILLYFTRSIALSQDGAVMATLASLSVTVLLAWLYCTLRTRIKEMDNAMPGAHFYQFVTKGYADCLASAIVQTCAPRKRGSAEIDNA